MSLFSRPFTVNDYPTVVAWWKAWNWPPIPLSSLSKNGIVVQDETGKEIVTGWLFSTDSDLAVFDWIISDRGADTLVRREATRFLLSEARSRAKELNFRAVIHFTNNRGLQDALDAVGWKLNDEALKSYSVLTGE